MKHVRLSDEVAMDLDIFHFAKSRHPYALFYGWYDLRRVRRAYRQRERHLAGKVRNPKWIRAFTPAEVDYGCRAAIAYFLKYNPAT